jgi:RNA polymerase sigma factor (sigma-70 family)
MYNICLRMTGNRQDAEDILQDAFYQAYRHLHELRSPDNFGAWLRRIVINRSISFIKSRIYFTDIETARFAYEENAEDNLESLSMKQINGAIQELPDGCRIIFNLFLLEDFSHREIAEMLNISESTSKSQYQRARKLLQVKLKKLNEHG